METKEIERSRNSRRKKHSTLLGHNIGIYYLRNKELDNRLLFTSLLERLIKENEQNKEFAIIPDHLQIEKDVIIALTEILVHCKEEEEEKHGAKRRVLNKICSNILKLEVIHRIEEIVYDNIAPEMMESTKDEDDFLKLDNTFLIDFQHNLNKLIPEGQKQNLLGKNYKVPF